MAVDAGVNTGLARFTYGLDWSKMQSMNHRSHRASQIHAFDASRQCRSRPNQSHGPEENMSNSFLRWSDLLFWMSNNQLNLCIPCRWLPDARCHTTSDAFNLSKLRQGISSRSVSNKSTRVRIPHSFQGSSIDIHVWSNCHFRHWIDRSIDVRLLTDLCLSNNNKSSSTKCDVMWKLFEWVPVIHFSLFCVGSDVNQYRVMQKSFSHRMSSKRPGDFLDRFCYQRLKKVIQSLSEFILIVSFFLFLCQSPFLMVDCSGPETGLVVLPSRVIAQENPSIENRIRETQS